MEVEAAAQFNLSVVYDNCLGVNQDYKEAAKWYREAAEQGETWTQLNLGRMYSFGQGFIQNNVYVQMWFHIEASEDGVGASRDILAREMTSVDISKAQKLACEYAKKKYKRR